MSTKTKQPEFVVLDSTAPSPGESEFRTKFGGELVGQPEMATVAEMIYNAYKNPLRDKTRPIGIYYLVGKSRTGKSKTARALAKIFHGDEEALTRVSASAYEDTHEMSDLKGAPPSYVGYRDPNDPKHKLQPEEVDSYSLISPHNLRRVRLESGEEIDIVVIEEFEKACPDFYKFWMDIFDRGQIKLRNGEVVDFRNTVFILTSNLATDEIDQYEQGGMGFLAQDRKASHATIKEMVDKAMKSTYRKEFRKRLDAVIVFRDLDENDIAAIVDLEVALVQERIIEQMPRGREFVLDVRPAARKFLLAAADGDVAELKRSIERNLLQPLGRLLASGKVNGGDLVRADHDGSSERLSFAVAVGAAKQSLADQLKVYPTDDDPESAKGLALQRRAHRSRQKAQKDRHEVKTWRIGIFRPNQDEFVDQLKHLIHDVRDVVGARVFSVYTPMERPWDGFIIVKATTEQVDLIKEVCPGFDVVLVDLKKADGHLPGCDC